MIKQADVSQYAIRHPEFDLRHDLHIFVDYVRNHEVKRKTNGNDLMKGDVKRLSKRLSYPYIMDEYNNRAFSVWLDFVDRIALGLGFIDYDTEGEYRGYSSSEPSFRDNYIEYHKQAYEDFLAQDINQQEILLFNHLLKPYSYANNEFFSVSPIGWLDGFPQFGSLVGILPHIDFASARIFLLEQLRQLEVGVWYDTASFIARLKQEHPYFLIPENPMREKLGYGYQHNYYRNKNKKKQPEPEYEAVPRYANLYEQHWNRRDNGIPADAPDGFERVEGRYIERFLEYTPLLLGYVELAYEPTYPQTTMKYSHGDEMVSRDIIKAFRVTPLLIQALEQNLPAPTVVVQPNFEIIIESAIYPASFLLTLSRFGKVTQQTKTTTITLGKQAIAAAVAEDENLNVIGILKEHSERALPQNILIELQEWVKRADVFTLYHGLDLVEDHIGLDLVEKASSFEVDNSLYLVPKNILITEQCKDAGQVVIQMVHSTNTFEFMPKHTQSIFPHEEEIVQEPEAVTIQQEIYITLHFPRRDVLNAMRQGLLDERCPVTLNNEAQTLTFPNRHHDTLLKVVASLADTYIIKIQKSDS
ncbi:MAG: hypothetical protein Phog2KO_19340 [Phototrophicaceae bacterium]